MNESIAVAKEADAKKRSSSTHESDERIHRAQNESERQLGSLGAVIDSIKSDGTAPSAESIATQMSGMHAAQRAPVLLALQQTHGNRYVQRVVAGIQAKLVVGQPGDKYEQEADRVADEVMRMPEPGVQRQVEPEEEEEEETLQTKPLVNQITPLVQVQRQEEQEEEEETLQAKPLAEEITPLVQRQVESEREEEEEGGETIQTKASPGQTPEVSSDLESRIHALKGGGQPLSQSERAFFELRFGYDFSQVRMHADARAAETAQTLNARAFTVGPEIVLGAGQYAPEATEGKRLLAHELTHVVQQRNISPSYMNSRIFSDNLQKKEGSEEGNTREKTETDDRELIDLVLETQNADFVKFVRNFECASWKERFDLMKIILAQWWVGPIGEKTLVRIWKSFKSSLIDAANTKEGRDLWKQSVDRGAELLEDIKDIGDFIRDFKESATKVTKDVLKKSEKCVISERDRYGITARQVDVIVATGMDKGQLWRRESRIKYEMRESEESRGLSKAAVELVTKRDEINKLRKKQSSYVKHVEYKTREGPIFLPKITDQAAYDSIEKAIKEQQYEYDLLRAKKEEKYPVLAAYAGGKGGLLPSFAKGSSNEIAATIGPKIAQILHNIEIVREALDEGKLKIWKLTPIVELTKKEEGIETGSLCETLIEEQIAEVEEDEILTNLGLSAIAIGLGLLAAIPTGGSSLVAAGSAVATVSGAGLGAYLTYEHFQEYTLQAAATGTDFQKARAISQQEPSLFWLALDIVFVIGDLGAAFHAFGKLAPIVRTAMRTKKTEQLIQAGNKIKTGLGDRVAESTMRDVGEKTITAKKSTPPTKAPHKGKKAASAKLGEVPEGKGKVPSPEAEAKAPPTRKVVPLKGSALKAREMVKMLRKESKEVVANLGGEAASHEVKLWPDAINVNHKPRVKDVPNLVRQPAERLGDLFDTGSVDRVVSRRLPLNPESFDKVAQGAFKVLPKGGKVEIVLYVGDRNAEFVDALIRAGFDEDTVKNVSNVLFTATK